MAKRLGVIGAVLSLCVGACGDDDEGHADNGGVKDAGGGGEALPLSMNYCEGAPPYDGDPYCLNLLCPDHAPLDGPHAARGACCLREPNALHALEAAQRGDATVTLGYRVTYSVTTNHPMSLGLAPVAAALIADVERERTGLLYRFEQPIDADGEAIAGEGSVEIGGGVSNCDGTFSYYAAGSAPEVDGRTDPDRWRPVKGAADYDPSRPLAKGYHIAWDEIGNRRVSYSPYYKMDGALDYELAVQGLDFLETTLGPDARDCSGSRDETSWKPATLQIAYLPLAENDLGALSATPVPQTLCQMLAFGIVAAAGGPDCSAARCTPGESGCAWVKLPDSLCPTTEAEQALFGCHVGDEDNPDGVAARCSATAPTTVRDPDQGADDDGQCCDPLAKSTTLPACNAYRVVNDTVLSAVKIGDTPADKLTLCP